MRSSMHRIHATPTSRVDNTIVSLDVSGEDATVDMGENPAYHPPAQVTELAISYKTTTTHHCGGDSVTITSEVTDITYTVTGKDYDTASVHHDFLNQPDAWPEWVRDLANEYNPAN